MLLVLAVGLPLPRTLAPLHGDRAGYCRAGCWLAEHTQPGDEVDDAYCWAHYFAGRVFVEGRTDLPRQSPPVQYVVIEHTHKRPRLQLHAEEDLLRRGGSVVASWPADRHSAVAEVRIYEIPAGERR